jgi:hypothetical protein
MFTYRLRIFFLPRNNVDLFNFNPTFVSDWKIVYLQSLNLFLVSKVMDGLIGGWLIGACIEWKQIHWACLSFTQNRLSYKIPKSAIFTENINTMWLRNLPWLGFWVCCENLLLNVGFNFKFISVQKTFALNVCYDVSCCYWYAEEV